MTECICGEAATLMMPGHSRATCGKLDCDVRFMIASTGRSGTTFTASVLSGLKVPCAHEGRLRDDRWNPDFPEYGECSWKMTPFLRHIPEDIPVYLQTRHPLRVIESYTAHLRGGATRTFQDNWTPERFGDAPDDHMEWACWHYCAWNEMALGHGPRVFQVERLPDFLPTFLESIGEPRNPEVITQWLASGAKNQLVGHQRQHREELHLKLKDIPESYVERLRALSERFGYQLNS